MAKHGPLFFMLGHTSMRSYKRVIDKSLAIQSGAFASLSRGLLVLLLATSASSALASFVTFGGGVVEEANWRTAVGNYALEDFELYPQGTQIMSLPALGIRFDELSGGGFPQAYLFGGTPYGPMHLGNFPNGINSINQWDDTVVHVLPGWTIYGFGFWNGDGQADTLVARAYDASGNLLGSVGAFKDTFAGFFSDVPVESLVFDGNTGDGWNHLDGLQTGFQHSAIPEPRTIVILLAGLFALAYQRHKYSAS